MKGHSFFTKLFLGNLLLIGVIIATSGIVSYRYLNANYQRDVEQQQSRTAHMMQNYLRHLWPQGADTIDAECKALFSDAPMRLTVIAADGRVLGDSQANPTTMENHKTKDRPEILAALQGKPGRDVRNSETLQAAYRYFAEPIRNHGKVVGAARIAMPIRAMAQGSSLIRNSLLLSALMGAIIAVALALLLSWIWYVPLRRITRVARRIASGHIEGRVRISGADELAQLGEALNEMAASLMDKIKQITVQRGNLNTVVHTLREGVIALDDQGDIVLMNASAHKLLDVEEADAQGKPLQGVVRIADVVTAFTQVMDRGEPLRTQIEREAAGLPKILDLLATRVAEPSAEGIRFLLVVRDITEQAQTARIKSEFVANASHELRTPLATIRAAVDSLESLGPDSQEEFEKIRGMLDRHTGRLEEMTRDLLSLHVIETARKQLRPEEIEAGSLVKWAQEHFAPQAEPKSVALEITTEEPSKTFTSDRTLLRLILQNLIDNAIKFTPADGRVLFHLDITKEQVYFWISDTGGGIPPELQGRVFERFFQVEASRSGDSKVRGTGLGLAIVKHAVERLRGTVTLQSELGKGTAVEVKLPATFHEPEIADSFRSGE